MTTFVLSHNLQVQSDLVPALNFELLAQELKSPFEEYFFNGSFKSPSLETLYII